MAEGPVSVILIIDPVSLGSVIDTDDGTCRVSGVVVARLEQTWEAARELGFI